MARHIDATVTDLYPLLPGESLSSDDPEDARQWVTIYRELVALANRTLPRLRREPMIVQALRNPAMDPRSMEGQLRRLHAHLEYWEQRFWFLAGLDLDVQRHVLNHRGRRLPLGRRETELLAYLARTPGRPYAAAALVSLAWDAPELSRKELRTYIARLRRHLATIGVPARLITEPGRGYALVLGA